jgi:sugar phosphate isomerase/epimerase
MSITHVGFTVEPGDGNLATLNLRLGRIADLGCDVAELSLYGHDLIAGGRIIEHRAAELAAICRRYPLRYTVHGLIVSDLLDPVLRDQQMAVARAMLELCQRVGADVLVQHGGLLHASSGLRPTVQEHERREREALGELADNAARRGVRIAVENIFCFDASEYRQTPSEIAETVRAIGQSSLVGLVDFGHAYIEGTRRGMDWLAEVRALACVSGHLHLHDNFGQPYTATKFYHPSEALALGVGDLHLPLGWGDIPWETIFDSITVLPGTALILEIDERFIGERPDSLKRARVLAERLNGRVASGRGGAGELGGQRSTSAG